MSHLYNLRKSTAYSRQRRHFEKTQPKPSKIGERRKPQPNGQPGYIRIDTVHQADLDKQKGVYHVNAVDEVTQFEVMFTVEKISERYLIPALDQLLESTSYLDTPRQWIKYDPELFHKLHDILNNQKQRNVSLIESTGLLPRAKYFSEYVPDSSLGRNAWFDSLAEHAQANQIVFLDPDNGIEIKSKPYGHKNSSKYVYWQEIKSLWESGKSLLIYQHFTREKRFKFIQRRLSELQDVTAGSLVEAFSTPHVLFLMVTAESSATSQEDSKYSSEKMGEPNPSLGSDMRPTRHSSRLLNRCAFPRRRIVIIGITHAKTHRSVY